MSSAPPISEERSLAKCGDLTRNTFASKKNQEETTFDVVHWMYVSSAFGALFLFHRMIQLIIRSEHRK